MPVRVHLPAGANDGRHGLERLPDRGHPRTKDNRMGVVKRQLHLNLFIHSRGHHEASWRHPSASPLPLTGIRYYQDLAQRAEAALFDSVFFADQLALGGDVAQAPRTWLEPVTVLAALAAAATRGGVVAPPPNP